MEELINNCTTFEEIETLLADNETFKTHREALKRLLLEDAKKTCIDIIYNIIIKT